ncbi:ribokinase [Croceitalea sp. MTPC5]|uniref:ribokinase n=1 Tax=Croceitalea sp. MTPC5 TaxID=3056565 RepID=UPI002B3ADF0E|nr:ribokinase [Croceitalea sp. MTPC5]
MEQQKIVVVGSSNTDMVLKSNHLPLPGETVLGGKFTMNPGGKGANQAVAAARLQGDVIFISRVGNDLFGKQAIKGFEKHGIDTRFITQDEKEASGVALIMVDEKGENSISVALGANNTLGKNHLQPAKEALKNSAFILTQLETPLATVEYLGEFARENQLKLILNPAPAQPLSDTLLASLHMLTPNEIEAELLSGVKVVDETSAMTAATILRQKGVGIVIITMGSQGAFVLSDELAELVPSQKVKVVDTTAAGDTFNGALVVALSEGKDLKSAVEFANKAAAYAVGILGAQTSAPSRKDIEIPTKTE